MPDINVNEIAQKLHLTPEQVSASSAVQNTYYKIKNNPNLSEEDKETAYAEMSSIFRGMSENK